MSINDWQCEWGMYSEAKGTAERRRRPRSTQSQQAVTTLLCAADRVRSFVGDVMEPFGITGQQYNVLRILRGAEPDGLPVLTIASRMIERAPGITRMIDRLEAKGLVTRERRGGDRRYIHCRITRKGLALLGKLDEPVEAANAMALAALKPKEQAQLIALLARVEATHCVK
jgi:MarR family transcriptional regulator, organic hydroperoxide resistance regulator